MVFTTLGANERRRSVESEGTKVLVIADGKIDHKVRVNIGENCDVTNDQDIPRFLRNSNQRANSPSRLTFRNCISSRATREETHHSRAIVKPIQRSGFRCRYCFPAIRETERWMKFAAVQMRGCIRATDNIDLRKVKTEKREEAEAKSERERYKRIKGRAGSISITSASGNFDFTSDARSNIDGASQE